jgi:hypothetical protein
MGLKRKHHLVQHKRLYGEIPQDGINCDELRIQLMLMMNSTDCKKYKFSSLYIGYLNNQNFVNFMDMAGESAGKRCCVYPLVIKFIEKNSNWIPGNSILPLTADEVDEINSTRYADNERDERDVDKNEDKENNSYWSSSAISTRSSTPLLHSQHSLNSPSQGYRCKRFAHHPMNSIASHYKAAYRNNEQLPNGYLPELIRQESWDTHWIRTCHQLRIPMTDARFIEGVISIKLPTSPITTTTKHNTSQYHYPPIYDTCDELRQTILLYLNAFSGMTPTRFARIIGSNVYAVKRFLQATLPSTNHTTMNTPSVAGNVAVEMIGKDNPVYLLAYRFFEKLQFACRIPKSSQHQQREVQLPFGYNYTTTPSAPPLDNTVIQVVSVPQPDNNIMNEDEEKSKEVVDGTSNMMSINKKEVMDPLDIWKEKLLKQSTVIQEAPSPSALTITVNDTKPINQAANALVETIVTPSSSPSSLQSCSIPSPPPPSPTTATSILLPQDDTTVSNNRGFHILSVHERVVDNSIMKNFSSLPIIPTTLLLSDDSADCFGFLPDQQLLSASSCTSIDASVVYPWPYNPSSYSNNMQLPSCSILTQHHHLPHHHQPSFMNLPTTAEPTRASFRRASVGFPADDEETEIQESMLLLGNPEENPLL